MGGLGEDRGGEDAAEDEGGWGGTEVFVTFRRGGEELGGGEG